MSREAETFGEAVLTFEPRVLDVVDFPDGSSVVREGLSNVTNSRLRGTAARAFEGYDHEVTGCRARPARRRRRV